MLDVRNQEWTQVLEHRSDVTLVGASSTAGGAWPRFAAGAVYHRPRRVEFGDRVVPVVDHLMIARIVVAAGLAMAMIWRLIRA